MVKNDSPIWGPVLSMKLARMQKNIFQILPTNTYQLVDVNCLISLISIMHTGIIKERSRKITWLLEAKLEIEELAKVIQVLFPDFLETKQIIIISDPKKIDPSFFRKLGPFVSLQRNSTSATSLITHTIYRIDWGIEPDAAFLEYNSGKDELMMDKWIGPAFYYSTDTFILLEIETRFPDIRIGYIIPNNQQTSLVPFCWFTFQKAISKLTTKHLSANLPLISERRKCNYAKMLYDIEFPTQSNRVSGILVYPYKTVIDVLGYACQLMICPFPKPDQPYPSIELEIEASKNTTVYLRNSKHNIIHLAWNISINKSV